MQAVKQHTFPTVHHYKQKILSFEHMNFANSLAKNSTILMSMRFYVTTLSGKQRK
jgi:hypothetical protein